MVTNAAAGCGGLGRSSSSGLIAQQILLNDRLAGLRSTVTKPSVCGVDTIGWDAKERVGNNTDRIRGDGERRREMRDWQ